MTGPSRSPLHDRHLALGAKLAEFGGWSMPLEYAAGVVKEHTAVRERAGIFDVSHLGKATVLGPGAAAFVNGCLSADLGRIGPGQAQYTLCCDDTTGGVVDDLIVYLRSDDEVFLVPNAANTAGVVARLAGAAPAGVEVVDRHHDLAVLAVQGPLAADVLDRVGLPSDHDYMSLLDATLEGVTADAVTVCRTGYTGERGYELVCAAADAPALWDAVLAAGTADGVLPCGLGARDTLRTEMGYPLHGQDIGPDVTPVQARLGWAVGWAKDVFWGREMLLAERERVPSRVLRGLVAQGRGIPRPHMTVQRSGGTGETGDTVGELTSGTFSPTLRRGVGLALLAAGVAEGDEVTVDVRGRAERFNVTRPPFVPSHVR